MGQFLLGFFPSQWNKVCEEMLLKPRQHILGREYIITLYLPTSIAPFNNEHIFWKILHQSKLLTEEF